MTRRPPVRTRRDSLVERGELRDPHGRAGVGRPTSQAPLQWPFDDARSAIGNR